MEGNVACAMSMCAYCLHNAENNVVLLAAILSKKERLNIIFVVTLCRHAWRCYEPFDLK